MNIKKMTIGLYYVVYNFFVCAYDRRLGKITNFPRVVVPLLVLFTWGVIVTILYVTK